MYIARGQNLCDDDPHHGHAHHLDYRHGDQDGAVSSPRPPSSPVALHIRYGDQDDVKDGGEKEEDNDESLSLKRDQAMHELPGLSGSSLCPSPRESSLTARGDATTDPSQVQGKPG